MSDLAVRDFMLGMVTSFCPDKAAGLKAVIQYKFTGEQSGNWMVDIHDQQCSVEEGVAPKPNLTISANALDYMDIMTGKKDGAKAFMQGKLKVTGDMGLAMKLQTLFAGK